MGAASLRQHTGPMATDTRSGTGMNRVERAIGTGMTVEAFAVPQRGRQAHFTDKKEIV